MVRSSGMVVVCLSELLMSSMSSAKLRLERFVLGVLFGKSDSEVTPLPLSAIGFMMCCKSALNKSELSGSP